MNAPLDHKTGRLALDRMDSVEMDGATYRPHSRNTEGWLLERVDRDAPAQFFGHDELWARATRGGLRHVPGAYDPHAQLRAQTNGADPVSALSEEARRQVRLRSALCEAFLEAERTGEVQRTDAEIKRAMPGLCMRAAEYLREVPDTGASGGTMEVPKAVSPRTMRRYLSAREEAGLAALADGRATSGNRQPRFTPEESAILMREVRGYASPLKPTQKTIHDNVKGAIGAENARREAEGLPPLHTPSREAVRAAIKRLDPFLVDIAREGAARARATRAPVGRGLDLTRPLERVEMDEWNIDLVTIMNDNGLLELLDAEDRARLGLDGTSGRWWLSVAICCTTRCILAMKLSRTPNTARSAIETLHMAVRDKGQWADAVGALSPWDMAGLPEKVVTDCGAGYKAFAFRAAASDLGVAHELAQAGLPELRGRVERLFQTVSLSLLPRLEGRTFSNVVQKGDADPTAVLTADDLAFALTRWVIDFYHNSPHEGLDGQTPLECWRALHATWGVRPPPDIRTRRVVFGTPLTRVAQRAGIRVAGVWYQSEDLQRWRVHAHAQEREVEIRWYAEDIGAIEAKIDGAWTAVPALRDGLAGVHAHTWRAAVRELRATHRAQAALSDDIVRQAIAAIEARNASARARAGLIVEDWSEERLAQEEARLFVGVDFGTTEHAPEPDEDHVLGEGIALPTGPAAGASTGASPGASPDSAGPDGPATGTYPGGADDPGFTIEE